MSRRRSRSAPDGGISRRRFLGWSAAAGAVAVFGPVRLRAATGPLIRRSIPASAERIPVIGLGTARTFDVDPGDPAAMAPLQGVMNRFFEGGGRLVDSSPMYGHAEAVVGALARQLGIADELFMATKVWTRGRENGIAQMERSGERMGGGRLELVQVHNLVDLRTQLDTLRRWREAGRVRYIGVTHYRSDMHRELAGIVEREPIDFVQFNYNIVQRNAEQRLLPAAADRGVAVLVNEPFERGTLFRRVRGRALPAWAGEVGASSWAQYFLKFIVSHPAVTCAIPATSDPAHAADNVGAAHGALPDTSGRERMVGYFRDL